jgi:hypothetical protein
MGAMTISALANARVWSVEEEDQAGSTISLFDGKTLNGWIQVENNDRNLAVGAIADLAAFQRESCPWTGSSVRISARAIRQSGADRSEHVCRIECECGIVALGLRSLRRTASVKCRTPVYLMNTGTSVWSSIPNKTFSLQQGRASGLRDAPIPGGCLNRERTENICPI